PLAQEVFQGLLEMPGEGRITDHFPLLPVPLDHISPTFVDIVDPLDIQGAFEECANIFIRRIIRDPRPLIFHIPL
ncbi:hypothetical protein, partial [Streptomyces kronopolitis]